MLPLSLNIPTLFADDSTLSCDFEKESVFQFGSDVNIHLNQISRWLNCNSIAINIDKTKYVIFSYRGGVDMPMVVV